MYNGDTYLPSPASVKYDSTMTRRVLALILMLAVGLQGSVAAFAANAPGQSDCQTTADSHTGASHTSCCPSGSHLANCCQDACPTAVAVTASSAALVWHRRAASILQFHTTAFSTRGDSPLIRPPIL
jgi:hypothetical protein